MLATLAPQGLVLPAQWENLRTNRVLTTALYALRARIRTPLAAFLERRVVCAQPIPSPLQAAMHSLTAYAVLASRETRLVASRVGWASTRQSMAAPRVLPAQEGHMAM